MNYTKFVNEVCNKVIEDQSKGLLLEGTMTEIFDILEFRLLENEINEKTFANVIHELQSCDHEFYNKHLKSYLKGVIL